MFMSLFFFILSVITFLLTHYWAKRSTPAKEFSFGRIFNFEGTTEEFHKDMAQWILKQDTFKLIEKSNNYYVLEEKASLFSYGYFYHIEIHQSKKDFLEITYRVQAKLVSVPKDQIRAGDELSEGLNLKEAS